MNQTGKMLERAGLRFEMSEPAMEQLLRRRERRGRNQRIAAGVVGIVIAIAGVGFAILALRGGGATRPASGPSPSPSTGDGVVGIVLPTVAIWIALAVLGLTAFAIVRLRRFVEVTPGDRTTGAPPAPGHGPAAAPRTAQKEGESTMDSREKMGVKIPQAEVPKIRVDEGRVSRLNRWLIGAIVLLAVAVVALGVALIASSGDEVPASFSEPDPAVVQAFDGWSETFSSGDYEAALGFWSEVGYLELADGRSFQGHEKLGDWYEIVSAYDLQWERVSDVIGKGRVGAALYHFWSGPEATAFLGPDEYMIRTIVLDVDGKIAYEREVVPPPVDGLGSALHLGDPFEG